MEREIALDIVAVQARSGTWRHDSSAERFRKGGDIERTLQVEARIERGCVGHRDLGGDGLRGLTRFSRDQGCATPEKGAGAVLSPCAARLLLRWPAGAISVGSMITSITKGPSEARPACSAAARSSSRATRTPSAPIARAMATKSE